MKSAADVRRLKKIERPKKPRGPAITRRDPEVQVDGLFGQERIKRFLDQVAAEDKNDVRLDRLQEFHGLRPAKLFFIDHKRPDRRNGLFAEIFFLGVLPVFEMADEIFPVL